MHHDPLAAAARAGGEAAQLLTHNRARLWPDVLVFVDWYEEPALRRQFGTQYENDLGRSGWWPRFPRRPAGLNGPAEPVTSLHREMT